MNLFLSEIYIDALIKKLGANVHHVTKFFGVHSPANKFFCLKTNEQLVG